MDENHWRDPAWLGSARAWIGERLDALGATLTGEVEQPHVAPWSTVLRLPTDQGTWWFKANEETLRHEAALVALVAARRPDAVPPLLASDPRTGWMLMADAGENLRSVVPREQSLARWLDVLGTYAAIQLDLEGEVDALLAIGVPDLRLATLPGKYDALVEELGAEQRFRDAGARVAELSAEVASYGIAETLQHDDLHDGQIFVRDGRHLVMDWGDSCVSHPFFTLSVTLEGVIAWGLDDEEGSEDVTPYRDAYLAPYVARYGRDVVAAVAPALRLGWACRAVNGHVPGDDAQTLTRLRMFLDGRP